MIQAFIAAALVAFTLGGGLGFWGTYHFMHVAEIEAQNIALKSAARKTAEAINFTESQDDEADAIEKHNKELIDAIHKKVDDEKTAALHNVQCVDADSLRDIAKIQ